MQCCKKIHDTTLYAHIGLRTHIHSTLRETFYMDIKNSSARKKRAGVISQKLISVSREPFPSTLKHILYILPLEWGTNFHTQMKRLVKL
jgi:hypothetical protein